MKISVLIVSGNSFAAYDNVPIIALAPGVDMNEVSDIVKIQLDEMPSWTIKQYSLDGTGSKQPTHSMGATPLYVMIPNETTVVNAQNKINAILAEK